MLAERQELDQFGQYLHRLGLLTIEDLGRPVDTLDQRKKEDTEVLEDRLASGA